MAVFSSFVMMPFSSTAVTSSLRSRSAFGPLLGAPEELPEPLEDDDKDELYCCCCCDDADTPECGYQTAKKMINVFNGPVDPMTLEEFAEERKSSDGDTPVFDSNVRRRAQVSYTDDGRKMLDGKLKENETPGTDALWSATITRGVAQEWKERAHGNGIRRAVRYDFKSLLKATKSIKMNRFFTRSRSGDEREPNVFQNIQNTFAGLDVNLEKPVLSHLKNVYATVAAGVGVATLGAMIHLFTNILR
ncbi:hypothetical protein WR25_13658 [Diploscapter pachys]|uniref:Uncharacterized protein n=1 Tax=Diploscapter pachys TaxID=2018661 RepID=A0A2A2KRF6_9BILA|nr:hypothetical protein WR25_13658 [Diploscapter pachys]